MIYFFFFFQAEDGIRDIGVTGVQTCALPICEKQVDLSSREFALLEYFMRHPGQVLSRQQILSAVWDYAFDPGSNVVDVYVSYLRNKIDSPGEPSLIETVRGSGYRFDPSASTQA